MTSFYSHCLDENITLEVFDMANNLGFASTFLYQVHFDDDELGSIHVRSRSEVTRQSPYLISECGSTIIYREVSCNADLAWQVVYSLASSQWVDDISRAVLTVLAKLSSRRVASSPP